MRRNQDVKGRGSSLRPANRFEHIHVEDDLEQLEDDGDILSGGSGRLATEYYSDESRSIISVNDSPDIPFRYSINPYRGCEHGCAYCYARPGHETLGLNAGLDFESRILVKHDAPRLLREALNRPRWRGELIAISGVTDCYQPAERRFRLTRGLLEVASEANQPVGIVTKNALVLRDLDLIASLAQRNLIHVLLSITTLDADLVRRLEPRTATPAARLRAVKELSAAGVPVGVMVAPVIPGLNDREIPAILQAAAEVGARSASWTLLRLPLAVRPIFEDWLLREVPLAAERIKSLVRDTRDGRMNDSRWGSRLRGEGGYAEQIAATFRVFAAKYGLNQPLPPLDSSQFRPPQSSSGQMRLF